MISEEMLSKMIGSSVALYPKEVADMLVRNKVFASAPSYSNKQLVEGVFIGLNQNLNFTKEYSFWLEQVATTLTF